MLERLANETFDVLVIGGGATGLGCAVDAAARGYRTALIEARDFAAATSSRSTKLIHGGVRYLAQGNVHLVREALHERGLLLANAPRLVHPIRFLTPAYRWYETPYYLAGLTLYDLLAGKERIGRSRFVARHEALASVPWMRGDGLHGCIAYTDAQFDDTRLAIALARTAADHGAALANYLCCVTLSPSKGGATSCIATVRDEESGTVFEIRARAAINAAGIFCDAIRRLDDPGAAPLLSLSRGTHVVLERGVLASDGTAVLIPKTDDGRVVFAIPWHERTLIGTTDVPAAEPASDPQPTAAEISYLLRTIGAYAREPLDERSVTAAFAGLRPLVERSAARTAQLSREHVVTVSARGLITIAGGKWTTYRRMAQDAVDAAAASAGLAPAPCTTERLALHDDAGPELDALIAARPQLAKRLHPAFPYTLADALNGFVNEMARNPDDVLYRRTRLGFLDRAAAESCRAAVAALADERA